MLIKEFAQYAITQLKMKKHVLLYCPFYLEFRIALTNKTCEINANFRNLNENEQLAFLFSSTDMIRTLAITCYQILHKMAAFLYK